MTRAVPQHQGAAPDQVALLTFAGGDKLAFSGSEISLTFDQRYRVVEIDDADRGPWKVETVAYLYDIDDAHGELLSYHWHPIGTHPEPRPHVHVRDPGGNRVRLPAGRVAIEEIILLLINEYEVPPIRGDWEEVLGDALAKFEAWQTWGGGPPPEA